MFLTAVPSSPSREVQQGHPQAGSESRRAQLPRPVPSAHHTNRSVEMMLVVFNRSVEMMLVVFNRSVEMMLVVFNRSVEMMLVVFNRSVEMMLVVFNRSVEMMLVYSVQ